ncbi:MAG: hypothetical protein H7301_14715 [Cryobacterium sp.]|nr:hypothetical protein [Oligoflexia bacterium]
MSVPSDQQKPTSPHELSLSLRIILFLTDFLLLSGLIAALSVIASPRTVGSISTHFFFPLILFPLASFFAHRTFGATPAEAAFGVKRRLPGGARASRGYDWIFLLTPENTEPGSKFRGFLFFAASAVLFSGAQAFLWMRDPTVHPLGDRVIPLHAPQGWTPLPFFYATGAFPLELKANSLATGSSPKKELSVEYGLPYEKGPPHRFLGKIALYWRDLDSRLVLSGPQTLATPGTQDELRRCSRQWFGCVEARRRIWKYAVIPALENRLIDRAEWFHVPNEFLLEAERAQGLYVRSKSERGRIREAYFLIGPKMASQGFILDRPDRTEGNQASETLAKIIGSLRLSPDLAAPRAFLDPKLAKLRIGPGSSLSDLITAEAHLLAKVSIEPKQAESFYHLSGIGITLYRIARREGRIELAATSKSIVKNALNYARDVDPKSARLPEMEKFQAEVDAK